MNYMLVFVRVARQLYMGKQPTNQQGVFTCILCAVITAATGLGDPVYCENGCGSPYCSICRKVIVELCQMPVMRSQTNFGDHKL